MEADAGLDRDPAEGHGIYAERERGLFKLDEEDDCELDTSDRDEYHFGRYQVGGGCQSDVNANEEDEDQYDGTDEDSNMEGSMNEPRYDAPPQRGSLSHLYDGDFTGEFGKEDEFDNLRTHSTHSNSKNRILGKGSKSAELCEAKLIVSLLGIERFMFRLSRE